MDEDFWKERYQDRWEPAARREELVRLLLEEEARCRVTAGPGLGAGSAQYLPGAAHRHGAERGGADLHVVGTNVYIEVTGPLTASVGPESDLWIRPDKIESAMAHPERDNWVVHALHDNKTLRAIHLDGAFERAYQNGRFDVVTPTIDDVQERYVAVPAHSDYVEPVGTLINDLRNRMREVEHASATEERGKQPAVRAGPVSRSTPQRAQPLPEPPTLPALTAGEPSEAAEVEDLSVCPACGSTHIATIVYGSIRVTEEMKRAMDAGLVEFGGLGEYEGMPTRRCLDCRHMFGRWTGEK